MDMNIPFIGSGGGSKSGSSGGVSENPNTLASVAYVQLVEALGCGEIVGLVNNEYSIYLDGVALRDLSGTPNYKPFQWAFRTGTQSQTYINGFAGTEQLTDVSTKVTVSSGPLIRPIPDQYADTVRVTVTFPALTQTTSKGEIQGTLVQYKVGVRKVGGTFSYSPIQSVNGKSTGEYQDTIEMDLTALGASPSGFEVTVVRITPDASSALVQNDLYWADYVIIHHEKFTYPNTALAALRLDSRYFSAVPTRTYHVKGRIIRVPKNYDPNLRTYATTGPGTTAGTWDGSFKWAYSNNPAWVFYDMLTNTIFGLGKRLNVDSNGYSPYVDRFGLYVIAQYCDELVPTGIGTQIVGDQVIGGFSLNGQANANVGVPVAQTEPRFTFNGVFNTQQDAYKVLQQLASTFRGMTYWAQSQVMTTQDSPDTVEFMVNNANVKDDKFAYAGSARANRHTVCTVGWNDPSENFKQKFEYVQDLPAVKQWGVRQEDLVLFGCTSQGQARRAGLWLLYTEKYETEQIVFTAGTDMSYILPGRIGEVYDARKSGVRWGGRTMSGTTTTSLVMDQSITLPADTYTVKIKLPDGTIGQSTVVLASSTTTNTLALSTALGATPLVGALWAISSNTVVPRQVRVIARTMDGPDSYVFTCLSHNPSKYGAIEDGLALESYSFSVLNTTVVSRVTGLTAVENSYKPTTGSATKVTVVTSWDKVTDPLQQGYMVEIKSATGGAYDYKSGLITDNFYTFTDVGVDTYTVTVVAVNQLGKQGPTTTGSVVVTGVDSTPPADVLNTSFVYTQDNLVGVTLKWAPVNDYISAYEIRKGASWAAGVTVYKSAAATYQAGPLSSSAPSVFWLKAIDTSGNYSVNAISASVSSTAPGAPTLVRTVSGTSEALTWTTPTAMYAIDHYVLKYGTDFTSGTTVNGGIAGNSFTQLLSYTGARTYWLAAVDAAGNVGTAASVAAGVTVPGAPTISQTFQNGNETLSWTVPAATLPIVSYAVYRGPTFATATLVASTTANNITRVVDYSGNKTYWVVAIDALGNNGTPGSLVTNVVAPAAPTVNWAISSVNEALTYSANANSLPIVAYAISYGSTYAGSTQIATTSTGLYTRRVDYGGTRRYWVAAVDSAGNVGTPSSYDATVTVPDIVNGKRIDVVDNNALIYWTPPTIGSLPIDRYEVRKGTTWAGGTVVGSNGNSTFAAVFEQQSGTYQYWITAVDSAGNFGNPSSISATINQPPDYVLRTDIMSTFTGTKTNLFVNTDGGLVGPTNTTETFAQHFTNQGITTPQQQITAGYPLYINPSMTTANYDETIDYGTTLSSSTVTVTPQVTVLQGSVTSSCQIYVKLLAGDAWTAAPAGNLSYLATNFRYVRVVITFTCTAGANLAELNSLEIKLSSKRISDGGSGTITNATTGLVVNFNRTFVSADTPSVQPTGTTPLIPVVDYTATAYPTSFTAYLYTLAGAKTTGSFSWTTGGF